jgi:hypothetical protein
MRKFVYKHVGLMVRLRCDYVCLCLAALLIAFVCSCSVIVNHPGQINPLRHAKVGDWVSYEILGGLIQKQTVTKISNGMVTIKIDVLSNGKIVKSDIEHRPVKLPANAYISAWGTRTGPDTVVLDHRSFSCIVYKQEQIANNVITRWYSDEIPVTGLVQMARNGQIIMKLASFGSGL